MRYAGYVNQGALAFTGIVGLVVLIVMLAAMWKLLEKAGEKGWKCLIPIYGGYVWYKVTWSVGAWAAMLGLGVLSSLFANVSMMRAVFAFAVLILMIVSFHMTSRAYGKGGGFTLGLCLLPVIFFPVLAFGSSEYVGPMGVPVSGRGGETPERAGTAGTDALEVADKEPGARPASGNSGTAPAVIFLCVTVLFFLAEAWLSMSKYTPVRGLFASPFVGMMNYDRLIRNPAFGTPLMNSFVYGLLTCLLTALAGAAGAAMGRGGSAGRKTGVTAGLLLAAVPRLFWESFTAGPNVAMPLDVLCGAMPWCGLALAGGAMLAGRRNGFRSALIVPALFLMTFFSTAGYPSLNINALTRRMMRMDGYLTQIGLQSAQYSVAAAGYVLTALIGLIPAAAGFALLSAMSRGTDADLSERRSSFACAAPGIVLTVLLLAGGYAVMAGSGNSAYYAFGSALSPTLAEMITAAVLGFGFFLLIQVFGGKNGAPDGLPRAFFAFAVLSLGRIWMSKYLFIHRLGFTNTVFAVALSWLLNPLVLTLAVLLAMTRPATMRKCLLNAGTLALMAIVFGIGEIRGSWYYLNRTGDLSMLLYRVYTTADQAAVEAGTVAAVRNAAWGLTMIMFALPLGIGTALAGLSVGKE